MDLHAIEAGSLRVLRSLTVCSDDSGNLYQVQGAGSDELFHGTDEAHVPGRLDRAGRHGQLPIEEQGIRDAPDMPELQEDVPVCLVDGSRDLFPAVYLLG